MFWESTGVIDYLNPSGTKLSSPKTGPVWEKQWEAPIRRIYIYTLSQSLCFLSHSPTLFLSCVFCSVILQNIINHLSMYYSGDISQPKLFFLVKQFTFSAALWFAPWGGGDPGSIAQSRLSHHMAYELATTGKKKHLKLLHQKYLL